MNGSGWLWMANIIKKGIEYYWVKTGGGYRLNVEKHTHTFTYMYTYIYICVCVYMNCKIMFMHFHNGKLGFENTFYVSKIALKNWVQVDDPSRISPLDFFSLLMLKSRGHSVSPFLIPNVSVCNIKTMLQYFLGKLIVLCV